MIPTMAVILAVGLCPAAGQSPQAVASPYLAAINLYRQGKDELALRTLAGTAPPLVTEERDALGAAFESDSRDVSEWAAATMRGAAMLHTAAAFSALERNNAGAFQFQLTFAQAYVDKLASANRPAVFVQTWRLLVLALFQEGLTLSAAQQFSRHAHDPHGDSAELLLALGAIEEMAWWMRHEEDVDPGVKGDLKDAERYYRQALILTPDSIEARLRLGRVLVLRDVPDGMKILGQIDQSAEPAYQFLARLFEGDVLERRGGTEDAEQRYSAAVSLMPTAQSAAMALAHLRHARGARSDAAQAVRSTAHASDVTDTADPWFWYSRGTAWRAAGYLADLRKIIAP